MNAFKSAVTTAGIGALGIGAYAIASPLMIPVGLGMVLAGGLGWLYQRAHVGAASRREDRQST